jgi:RNA polymerase sigma-70 factor (ECF subfamily)
MHEIAQELAAELSPEWRIVQPFGPAERAVSREAERAALEREFEQRVAECSGLAFRVARGVLHDSADAEEVAQDAFLRAFRKLHRLREPKSFRAWLVRITFRLALDRLRSASRRVVRETAWMVERQNSAAHQPAAAGELRAHLHRAMDALPERLRFVLILTAIEGHSLSDVAEMLGLPEGTVKSRLHFARKELAEKLRCIAEPTKTI